jgi:hypothetical protein
MLLIRINGNRASVVWVELGSLQTLDGGLFSHKLTLKSAPQASRFVQFRTLIRTRTTRSSTENKFLDPRQDLPLRFLVWNFGFAAKTAQTMK